MSSSINEIWKFNLGLIFALSVYFLAGDLSAAGPRKTVSKGIDYYNAEEYDKALAEFLTGVQNAPERDEVSYDVGTAFYKLQKYPEAMSAFSKTIEGQSPEVIGDAWYNLGNALVNDGKLEEAIGAYSNSLKVNHTDMDAKYNLETVRRLMKMQQQQQQQQGGESDSTQQQQQQNQQPEPQDGQGDNAKPEPNEDQQENEQQAQNNPNSDGEPQDSTSQPKPEDMNEMSEEEAQQLLQAMQGDELDAIKEKLRRQFGKPKRVEKDW